MFRFVCKFQVIRITVLVTDTTAPSIQQGEGLLIITITDVNEEPPVSAKDYPVGDVGTALLAELAI